MAEIKSMNRKTAAVLPRWLRFYLNQDDVDAIETKITEIERQTAGELVLLITRQSFDWRFHYPLVSLFLLLMFMIFVEDEFMSWFDYQFLITSYWAELGLKLSIFILILMLSQIVSRLRFVSRLATPEDLRRRMAEIRAELEFFRSDIKKTKASTGILLFLAVEDRQAVVLADNAIASKLPPETWDHILAEVLSGIKSSRTREGILKAIEMSGAILQESFPIQPGDTNELENRVIIKDRSILRASL